MEMARTALRCRRGGEMQIVEYLYATVHGNDLHGGIETLGHSPATVAVAAAAARVVSILLSAPECKVEANQIGYILVLLSARLYRPS